MEEYKKMYDCIFEDFKHDYPTFASDIVDWYPCGQMEIVVKQSNGNKGIYNMINHTYGIIYDKNSNSDSNFLDEDEWINKFKDKLNKKMRMFGMNQDELSELTGISRVSINKYINGKAIPNTYNLDKIAWALRCSTSELTNIR